MGDAVNVIHIEERCLGWMCFVFIDCAQAYKNSKIKIYVPNFKVNTSIKYVHINIYTDTWNVAYQHSLMWQNIVVIAKKNCYYTGKVFINFLL